MIKKILEFDDSMLDFRKYMEERFGYVWKRLETAKTYYNDNPNVEETIESLKSDVREFYVSVFNEFNETHKEFMRDFIGIEERNNMIR